MTIRPLLIVGIVVIGLASVVVVARVARRPIFRFLENRNKSAARSVILDYLEGRTPLDSAAARLNPIMDRIGRYHYLSALALHPRTASLEALSIAPPGYRHDDPRIEELFQRGMYLRMGPEHYHQTQEWLRQQREARQPRQSSENP